MSEMQTEQKISRERRKRLLARLKAEIGPYKRHLYIAALFSWFQFLMRILSFFLIAQNIERLYHGGDISILWFVVELVVLNLVGFLAALVAKNYQGTASQHARNKLKGQFFQAFQGHEGEFEEATSVADVMTVATQGIDTLDTYFNHYLSISLRAYFNCVTILVLVAVIYPIGGGIFLASLPLIPVSIILMQKRSKKIMNRYWGTYMDVGNLFMDDLKGMNTLYTYDADQHYEKTFMEKAEDFRLSTMELLKFQLQSVGYMDGVMYIGVGVSGFAAVVSLSQGQLSLFSLVFFVLIAAEFFAPIREMGYGMHLVMMNTKIADRIYTFLDSVSDHSKDEAGDRTFKEQISEITFDQVNFAYGKDQILSDLSLTIPKGQLFAVAGESGLGKTTLAKLIQKQMPLSDGQIYFNQTPLAQLGLDDVRQQVMYVSPDSYLFSGSIYDNLSLATDWSEQDIMRWAKSHHLLTFLDALPDGLATQVGENGHLLSPGQRQQIICARALLAKRSIYIFDEMTSSIDNENEQEIFNYIKLTAQQAIVLFISHKMKQILQTDQVLFMDKKSGSSLGKPEELLKNNVAFRELVKTQAELEAILHG